MARAKKPRKLKDKYEYLLGHLVQVITSHQSSQVNETESGVTQSIGNLSFTDILLDMDATCFVLGAPDPVDTDKMRITQIIERAHVFTMLSANVEDHLPNSRTTNKDLN